MLAALLALVRRFSLAWVGPVRDRHYYAVAGANRPSNHATGRAVGIGTIDGEPVSPTNPEARAAALALASLPASLGPDELGSPFADVAVCPVCSTTRTTRTTAGDSLLPRTCAVDA